MVDTVSMWSAKYVFAHYSQVSRIIHQCLSHIMSSPQHQLSSDMLIQRQKSNLRWRIAGITTGLRILVSIILLLLQNAHIHKRPSSMSILRGKGYNREKPVWKLARGLCKFPFDSQNHNAWYPKLSPSQNHHWELDHVSLPQSYTDWSPLCIG